MNGLLEQTIDLAYNPRPWQRECHMSMTRFTVLALHRRAGKTEAALRELLENAMTCRLTMPTYFYVAPFLKQAKTIAWARLKQIVEPLRAAALASINESELTVTLPFNGAVIRVFGADNPDAMRGVRLDGVVLDEVAQIKPEVWDEILQPTLSDRMGWALFIGTPKGVNLFSQLFYKALSGSPGWTAAKYTVYDTQAIAEEEVERLRADMTEQAFAREYLCDFTAAGDDQVLSLLEAEDAARRHYREEDYSYAPRILGCDPARFGGDRSVITRRQGLVVLKMTAHRGLNNMQLADKLAHEIDLWEADATFVDVGGGAGVIDRLIQLGHTVHEVNFGAGAADPRFLNKRSEVWWGMADWIRAGGAIPDDMELKQELATPTYSYTVSNKIQIESKDDIKKRLQGGASPDKADSLATTFAMPVQKRDIKREVFEHMGVSVSRTEREYDPFANI